MRVSIDHGEIKQGYFTTTTLHTVTVSVQFTETEKAIISERKLSNVVVLERDPPVNAKVTEVKGLGSALKVVSGMGKTVNGFHLLIGDLAKGPDTYTVSTPVDAKVYENHLTDKLRALKDFLEGNAEAGTSKSFEL